MSPNNLGTGVGNCPPALYINLYGAERGGELFEGKRKKSNLKLVKIPIDKQSLLEIDQEERGLIKKYECKYNSNKICTDLH